jgi:hypothetical protein
MRNFVRVRLISLAVCLLLAGATPLLARVGVVRARTGEVFEGQIRITPEQITVANTELRAVFSIAGSNVARISFPANATSASQTILDDALPPEWREVDIGASRVPGSTRHESGTFTVRGAGFNIDGEADSFHYVFKPVRGESEIVAEITSIQYTHPNAKAGLMMRENLGEYSRNVMIALTAMNGGALQFRSAERANTEDIRLATLFPPQWLKLRRRGNEFSAFVSANGRTWFLVEKIPMEMNENFYVGLASASARDDMLNWTTFRRVREGPKLINEDFTPEIQLISGSTISGRPDYADENEIVFNRPPKLVRVPTDRVARIAFQPLSGELAWKTRVSHPGVWVNNGDFFDGEFRAIQGSKLTISSVLYGLRSFDVDDEVSALVLRPHRRTRPECQIETIDGAVILGLAFTLGDGEIRVQESALGDVRIPAFEIIELRRR